MDTFVREEVEPVDALWGDKVYERPMDKVLARHHRAPEAAGARRAAVGLPSGPGPRRRGLRPAEAGVDERDPRARRRGARRSSERRPPTRATPRSSPTTAPTSRRRSISSRCSTADIISCYSMTEPQGGADPRVFTTRAERDGDEWVINGWKFFSSNARWATFFIVMTVTDPDVEIYRGASMFLVPADTPGVNIVRNVGLGHGEIGRGLPRVDPLRQRAGPGGKHAGRRGPGLRHRPDPPRRRPDPPRHADGGPDHARRWTCWSSGR